MVLGIGEQVEAIGLDDDLELAVGRQLDRQVADVGADRLIGDRQKSRDLVTRDTLREKSQDLKLALREPFRRILTQPPLPEERQIVSEWMSIMPLAARRTVVTALAMPSDSRITAVAPASIALSIACSAPFRSNAINAVDGLVRWIFAATSTADGTLTRKSMIATSDRSPATRRIESGPQSTLATTIMSGCSFTRISSASPMSWWLCTMRTWIRSATRAGSEAGRAISSAIVTLRLPWRHPPDLPRRPVRDSQTRRMTHRV